MMVVMVWEPGLEVSVLIPVQLVAREFSCCLRAPDGVNDDLLQVLQPFNAIFNAVRAFLCAGNIQAKVAHFINALRLGAVAGDPLSACQRLDELRRLSVLQTYLMQLPEM